MVLKCAIVLCLVSVFGCKAYEFSRPYSSRLEHYRPYHSFGSLSMESDESEEEYLQKEYASLPHSTTYFVSSQKLSWENARYECKAKGMMLASPINQEQKLELYFYLQKKSLLPADPYSGYWIGGKRLSSDEPWIWEVDGQEVKSEGWLRGEPNGFDGEDCMEFKYDIFTGWNNYYCSAQKRFICQSKPHINESEKNNIKNPQFSQIHEEILKENNYQSDITKSKESLKLETTTTAATTTTNQYSRRLPFRFAARTHMPVFPTRRPWFYHTEEPSSSPETSSKTSVTTNNGQTESTKFSTLHTHIPQTETSRATESTLKTNLLSSTDTTEKIISFPTTSERVIFSSSSVSPWVYLLTTTERSSIHNMAHMDTSLYSDIMVDRLIRRNQERQREFLRGLQDESTDSSYEYYNM